MTFSSGSDVAIALHSSFGNDMKENYIKKNGIETKILRTASYPSRTRVFRLQGLKSKASRQSGTDIANVSDKAARVSFRNLI